MVELPKFSLKKINLKKIITVLVTVLVLVMAIIFLIAHTFNWTNFTIDSTSIILLLLILCIPFVDSIRKIKYGDFEAEISSKEVAQTINKVNDEYPTTSAHANEFGKEIIDLVQSDSQLGLAKLKFELEKSVKRLLNLKKNQPSEIEHKSLYYLIGELLKIEAIPKELVSALKNILPLINRAVHGEYVKDDDAIKIAQSGIHMLNNLNEIYQDLAYKPIEKIIISMNDIETYEQAKYRVTTIIPYIDNPEKNIYIWDRDTLLDFLLGIGEYAEFPISIEKLN